MEKRKWGAVWGGRSAVLAVVAALTAVRMVFAESLQVAILDDDAAGPHAAFWQATIDHLNHAVPNTRFVLEPMSHQALLAALQNKTVACAIADPALIALAGAEIRPLATIRYSFRAKEFNGSAGALVVQAARPDLRTWSDLKASRIVTAHASTLADWRAVEQVLKSSGWRGRVEEVSSRPSALREVAEGRAEAAAVPAGLLETLQANGTITAGIFHVMAADPRSGRTSAEWPTASSTPAYPGPCFVVTPQVSPDRQRLIATALMNGPPFSAPSPSDSRVEAIGWDACNSIAPVVTLLAELGVPPYSKLREMTLADVARQYMYVFILAGLIFVVALGFIVTLASFNRVLRAEVLRRREAEKSLRHSVERFEHIAACSSDWIWECDERGVYTYANANVRSMLGYEPQEILGRHHLELMAALDRERLTAEGRHLFDGGRRLFREVYRMRTKDGRLVVHEITAEPVRDAGGKVIGYRGVNRDITDRARAVRLIT